MVEKRYNSQISLPQIGIAGQHKLREARILVVGAGGLGCPALQFLAGAGVGRLGIVDGDRVTVSNLHRQLLYNESQVGMLKAEAAAYSLNALNSDIEVVVYPYFLDEHNAFRVVKEYDVIIDGTDNVYATRVVEKACIEGDKPHVYGGVHGFQGQVCVFNYSIDGAETLLYTDLFGTVGNDGSCEESGTMGPVPGIIGTLQAVETIKIVLGLGTVLNKELLVYDMLLSDLYKFCMRKSNKQQTGSNYAAISKDTASATQQSRVLTVTQLHRFLEMGDTALVDIRNSGEYPEISQLDHHRIPLHLLPDKIGLLTAKNIVLACQSGIRSGAALGHLQSAIKKGQLLFSLAGGVRALSADKIVVK